jgi:hypothetical protein
MQGDGIGAETGPDAIILHFYEGVMINRSGAHVQTGAGSDQIAAVHDAQRLGGRAVSFGAKV